MLARPVLLSRFHVTRPRYEMTQARAFEWLSSAHATAEAVRAGMAPEGRDAFAARIAHAFERCGCPPAAIARRGFAISDVTSNAWSDNEVYNLHDAPRGPGSAVRTRRFDEIVEDYFVRAYADNDTPPDELVHVTCTGYVSPSGAQKLVAHRRWPTRVTHAYHMGCYAAVPAVRIAAGLLRDARRVDVVHTELCSLHMDPTDHRIEQLVVQSLFADGMIRYSVGADEDAPGLRLLRVHERVLPDSADAMGWIVGDHGMQMTLARNVPDRIASTIRGFTLELLERAGLGLAQLRDAVLAVHPGGPKIIARVRDMLELDERQLATSRRVLLDHGNMSSATLPHIWSRIVDDRDLPRGTHVASLAFGPGLTMCGAVFEKR